MKIYKCGYTQCKYDGEVSSDIAMLYNKRHYHKECLAEKNNKIKIRTIFYESISKTVVFSELNRAINNIIHVKNVDSEYLLFALKEAIRRNVNLQHPNGLYYIINYGAIKNAYENTKIKIAKDIILEKNEEITFQTKSQTKNDWNKIGG